MKERGVSVKNPYIFRDDLIMARGATAVQRIITSFSFKEKGKAMQAFYQTVDKV